MKENYTGNFAHDSRNILTEAYGFQHDPKRVEDAKRRFYERLDSDLQYMMEEGADPTTLDKLYGYRDRDWLVENNLDQITECVYELTSENTDENM